MKHRPSRLIASLTLAASVLTGCGGGSDNADAVNADGSVDLSKVTLVVGDQKGGSEALLRAAGALDELPYRVEWKPFTSGPPLLEAVASDAVDVGGVGNTPPLFAIDQDKDLKVVQATYQGTSGDAIVVQDDSPVQDVADLAGKKVALAKGSSANFNLLAQLEAAGLSLDDIEPVYLQPTEALAAFTGGSVDAWAIWDPFTAQAELADEARVIAEGGDLVNGLAFQVAGDDALDDKATRAAVEDYVGRIAAAQVWANDHAAEWAQAWAEETGLPAEVTERAISRRDYEPVPVDAEIVASEQEMWDAFAAQGQVSADPDLSQYFLPDFNDVVTAATERARGSV